MTDNALAVVDKYREEVGDEFSIATIEEEFPYLAAELAREFGARGVYLARADANESGTFKVRGALVALEQHRSLTPENQTPEDIWAYSAGNYASGLAVAGRVLGVGRHIAVPQSAPPEKREGLYRFDSDRSSLHVHVVGNTLDETREWVSSDDSRLVIPPHDPYVTAGQGTYADDILQLLPSTTRIVTPVGVGSLAGGLRNRLDALGREDVIVHGVEAEGSNSMSRSLLEVNLTDADRPNPRYGGSAVRQVGEHTLAICRRGLLNNNFVITGVSDRLVDYVMSDYAQSRQHRELDAVGAPTYEPTTLVAIAGLYHIAKEHPNETIVVIGTGHNAPLPAYV
jgi:threonine dehydratase